MRSSYCVICGCPTSAIPETVGVCPVLEEHGPSCTESEITKQTEWFNDLVLIDLDHDYQLIEDVHDSNNHDAYIGEDWKDINYYIGGHWLTDEHVKQYYVGRAYIYHRSCYNVAIEQGYNNKDLYCINPEHNHHFKTEIVGDNVGNQPLDYFRDISLIGDVAVNDPASHEGNRDRIRTILRKMDCHTGTLKSNQVIVDRKRCIACKEKPGSVVFDCDHFLLCVDCVEIFTKCLRCQYDKTKTLLAIPS
jgi:hypothetical protein